MASFYYHCLESLSEPLCLRTLLPDPKSLYSIAVVTVISRKIQTRFPKITTLMVDRLLPRRRIDCINSQMSLLGSKNFKFFRIFWILYHMVALSKPKILPVLTCEWPCRKCNSKIRVSSGPNVW
jgi:hypothetical protein